MECYFMQKKTKNLSTSKRGLGVILESMDSKFDQLLESHSALDKKIEDLKHDTNEKFGFVTFSLNLLSKGQKDILVRFDRLEDKYDKNFNQILEYLSRIDEEIQDLKKRLDRKADLERLLAVEKRVGQIELVVKKYLDGQNSN